MRRTSTLWEVFVLRFEEALELYRKRRLTADEAGEVLGMSGRHFRRMVVRYDEEGVEGLRDRRLGRRSPRRAPGGRADAHADPLPGALPRLHGEAFSRAAAETARLQAGLHRDAAGAASERSGSEGQAAQHPPQEARAPAAPRHAVFQDGSTHRWIVGLDHDLDLVVTLDDATGAIYSAILVAQEGTMSSFLGLSQTIAEKGLFRAFYTGRGSHYFFTPRAGGKRCYGASGEDNGQSIVAGNNRRGAPCRSRMT